jgi:hypothetical protein
MNKSYNFGFFRIELKGIPLLLPKDEGRGAMDV